jgi:hypothetical protein
MFAAISVAKGGTDLKSLKFAADVGTAVGGLMPGNGAVEGGLRTSLEPAIRSPVTGNLDPFGNAYSPR